MLVNQIGDIRVRPTIFEVTLHNGGYSVVQHLLKAYLEALGSVLVAQFFKYKALDGGLEGVKELARSPSICRQLAVAGIDLPLLLEPPLDIEQTIQQGKNPKLRNNLMALVR